MNLENCIKKRIKGKIFSIYLCNQSQIEKLSKEEDPKWSSYQGLTVDT